MQIETAGSQQVSFTIPAELVAYLTPYANVIIENNFNECLADYHRQRLELQASAMLNYEEWHATDYVKEIRAQLTRHVKPESLPYYRDLESLYEEYKAAFKSLHGRRPGRTYRKRPDKASLAWALGVALMDFARSARLKTPASTVQTQAEAEDRYSALAQPDAQMLLLAAENLLPLHRLRPKSIKALEAV